MLSRTNEVIHGIHRPYYYSHSEREWDSFGSGACAQLALSCPTASRHDLTPTGTYCQCGASDWSPVFFPSPGLTTPRQTTKKTQQGEKPRQQQEAGLR